MEDVDMRIYDDAETIYTALNADPPARASKSITSSIPMTLKKARGS